MVIATSPLHNRETFNHEVATRIDRIAELLAAQKASFFRIRAYRNAAEFVREAEENLLDVLDQKGIQGLEALPHIGARLGALIQEFALTGRMSFLRRLEGKVCPEDVLATVPGIGPLLASRIHRDLGVESLEDLEVAAYDGRLETIPSLGVRKIEGIRQSLDSMLRHQRHRSERRRPEERPSIPCLLHIDKRYRSGAKNNALPRIAPGRFNPDRVAWLPIMHAERDGFEFTVLFSNTARAHDMGKTRDWVVVFYHRVGDGAEGQCTIVTEHAGALAGRRVVRGREADCWEYYTQREEPVENGTH